MRRIELEAALPAPAERAWRVLLDVERWPEWGRLVTSAEGELVAGHRWTMHLRARSGGAPRRLRPRFLSLTPQHELVFETRLGAAWLVRMVHRFEVVPDGPTRSVLRQRFAATGLLVPLLWGPLSRGMTQFEELGEDLARRLG